MVPPDPSLTICLTCLTVRSVMGEMMGRCQGTESKVTAPSDQSIPHSPLIAVAEVSLGGEISAGAANRVSVS